ncbi:OmpW family protein [Paraburkholderia sp. UYCP14C]|uniref:OmpW/AlkL family protein n=1 Tax=Paraburkholderia sp. UYCP14C TaxID=2511130 RepID=UPI001021BEDD|nr:OmpW family outer membrane protein [Paraburkholderia sp. UYCP14C]RZF25423.1 OmpW family protein [Paraburkholderia sp. UYCP14C]
MKQASVALVLSIATIATAHAQSAGSWEVRAGWLHLSPQDSSQPLTVNALGQSSTIAGSGATIGDADTFALTARYYFTDHVAVETVLGAPPQLHFYGTGPLAPVGELGTTRAYSPAIQAEYHFGEPGARLRPYIGAGVSYVRFGNTKLSEPVATGQLLYSPTLGTLLEGPTSTSLSSSFAPLVNAGLTYNFDSHWSIGASISYMWLSTKATLTTRAAPGIVTTTSKVKIDPIVTFLSIGYQF